MSLSEQIVCTWLNGIERLVRYSCKIQLDLELERQQLRDRIENLNEGAREVSELNHHLSWLRSRLRRFPFWKEGHTLLFELSLVLRNIELAHSSALAVAKLAKGERQTRDAEHLLARAYMANREPQNAIALLEKLFAYQDLKQQVAEDLAVCYFSLGRSAEAEQILLSLSQSELTESGRLGLKYLKNRLSQD